MDGERDTANTGHEIASLEPDDGSMRGQREQTARRVRSAGSPQADGSVIVRAFTPSDLERVARIEDASFPVDAFSESRFWRLHAAYPRQFLVAEASGDIVGYIAGSVAGDCGQIESVAVDRESRGRGIGSRLTRRLLARFRQIGLRSCALEVRITNADAIALYRRLGFHIVRTLAAYYPDGSNAFLMEKDLADRRGRRGKGREV